MRHRSSGAEPQGRDDARFAAAVETLERSRRPLARVPTFGAVVELLHDVEALLFPEFREEPLSIPDRAARMTERLEALLGRAGLAAEAREVSLRLLEALPQLRSTLDEDAAAALRKDPAATSVTEVIVAYPSMRAVVAHRLAHFLHRSGVPIVPRMLSEYAHGKTGIDIHPGASIGPGLFIDHGTGVVIGETAVIGRNCTLYQGVTLGALSVQKHVGNEPPRQRHPTLEDEVTVYSHAVILGGATVIGEGSVIGGNVWLTRSVPPHTKVLAAEADLVFRNSPRFNTTFVEPPIEYEI